MEIIDKNLPIVLGQMIRVNNLKRRPTENKIYVALQVEDEDGENERCLLFSEIELADDAKIKSDILNSNMVFGRFYKFTIGKKNTNLIKIKNYDGDSLILRISNSQLIKAEKRAKNNKEDLTKKSIFTDMID